MQKYVSSGKTETIGVAMENFFVSMNSEEFQAIVSDALYRNQIDTIDDERWYPQQITMDILKEIGQKTTPSNLIALGMAYVETALFPPQINDIHTGLTLLAETYHMNNRYVPANEGYETHVISDDHIQVVDNNPFPHDTVYGFIWGICKRFAGANEQFSVYRTFVAPDDPDSDGAIYDIKITR